MSYEIGDTVEGETVARVGKQYHVVGYVEPDVEFGGLWTHNLAEAKRCAKKLSKTGMAQINEYECCFNEYGEMIQHLDDRAAVFEHYTSGFTRVAL